MPGVVGNASWIDTDDIEQGAAAAHYNAAGHIVLGTRFANEFTPVPEPSTMTLIGMGLLGLAVYGIRSISKGECKP